MVAEVDAERDAADGRRRSPSIGRRRAHVAARAHGGDGMLAAGRGWLEVSLPAGGVVGDAVVRPGQAVGRCRRDGCLVAGLAEREHGTAVFRYTVRSRAKKPLTVL